MVIGRSGLAGIICVTYSIIRLQPELGHVQTPLLLKMELTVWDTAKKQLHVAVSNFNSTATIQNLC